MDFYPSTLTMAATAVSLFPSGPLAPTRLRIDHAPAPRGIARSSPSLSFALAHTERAQDPSSFELDVVRVDAVAHKNTTVWAARITAPDGILRPVRYNSDGSGYALSSDSDYFWRARWTDNGGLVSPWSEVASFSTALLNEADWHGAQWIGTDGPDAADPFVDADEANRFRVEVHLRAAHARRCSLMISGLGYYKASIEGRVLDDHELGESTQFQRRIPYDNLDCLPALEKALKEGPTGEARTIALAVELGRGWYGEERIQALGNHPSGPRMLRCLLSITFDDGSVQRLSSDPATASWRRGRGPVVFDALHRGTVYDARRETPGWKRAGFDDTTGGWVAVNAALDITCGNVRGCPDSKVGFGNLGNATLSPMLHPKIRKTRELRPASVMRLDETRFVVDLGENIAGWCRYELVPAGVGGNVTFLHSERLDPSTHSITPGGDDGVQPLTKNLTERSWFIFNESDAAASYEPRFVSYGFRYVQLDGPLRALSVQDIVCWAVHTDLERTGSFEFEPPTDPSMAQLQERLMAVYKATIRTADANWISFPTDCPHRERRGWLGDAQAAAHTLDTTYDMSAANVKWIQDIADATSLMYANGNIGTIAPQYNVEATGRHPARHTTGATAPAWSAAFVLMWDWTWRRANDLELAERHYARAKAYVDFLGAMRDNHTHVLAANWDGGHAQLLGDWCAALGVNGTQNPAGGVAAYQARHSSGTFNTFYYILTHEAVLRAAVVLSRTGDEAALRSRISLTRSGFNFAFFQRQTDTYADPFVASHVSTYGAEPLQSTLSLALALGVAEVPHVNATAAVRETLVRDIVQQGNRMTVGLIGSGYLFSALASGGRRGMGVALDVLGGVESPSYGFMVEQGPGTLWESPDGNSSWHRPRGSLNHIMLGGFAGPFFFGALGGIQLPDDSIGWATVRIAPALTPRVRGFRAQLQTFRGLIATAWAWQDEDPRHGFALNVSLPVGTTANVTFPESSTVREAGTVVWSAGKLVPGGVIGLLGGKADADGSIQLEIASGDYLFSAT